MARSASRTPDAMRKEELPAGVIPIDSFFSPVRKVNYTISQSRVGQRTDYDKLELEVWTDGSVRPEDAVAYGSKILKDQLSIFINFDETLEPEVQEPIIEKEGSTTISTELSTSAGALCTLRQLSSECGN